MHCVIIAASAADYWTASSYYEIIFQVYRENTTIFRSILIRGELDGWCRYRKRRMLWCRLLARTMCIHCRCHRRRWVAVRCVPSLKYLTRTAAIATLSSIGRTSPFQYCVPVPHSPSSASSIHSLVSCYWHYFYFWPISCVLSKTLGLFRLSFIQMDAVRYWLFIRRRRCLCHLRERVSIQFDIG